MIQWMIDFRPYSFHPVIKMPETYEVYDFTQGYDPSRSLTAPFGIGRYNEKRKGMYTTPLFNSGELRNIHMGIDIAAPVGTPVHAFHDGEIFLYGYNGADGDYGYTLITHHTFPEQDLFVLHGHLSKKSIKEKMTGQKFARGEILAWVGDRPENGGWNPHLHFQLSLVKPEICDMPGAVSEEKYAEALKIYPDPRLVLGPLY